MAYTKQTYKDFQESINKEMDEMNKKIDEYFNTPEQLMELFEFMDGFYDYSTRNMMLIQQQFHGAKAVAPYAIWQKEHDAQVLKGEKAMNVFVPQKFKKYTTESGNVTFTQATPEQKKKIKANEYPFVEITTFKFGKVFDISQTDYPLEKYPELYPNRPIGGKVENFPAIYEGIKKLVAQEGIKFGEWEGLMETSKGYVVHPLLDTIYLNPKNTETENILTTLHELAHTQLHKGRSNLPKEIKEYQAEMVSYLTAKHFGLEHESNSVNYLAGWAKGKKIDEQVQFIDEIRNVTKHFIKSLEPELAHLLVNENDQESALVSEEEDLYAFCNIDIEKVELTEIKKGEER